MFSAEHFIFILFPEIKQFRGSENMCLQHFKNHTLEIICSIVAKNIYAITF